MGEPFAVLEEVLEVDIFGLEKMALWLDLSGVACDMYIRFWLQSSVLGAAYRAISATISLSSIVFRPACAA